MIENNKEVKLSHNEVLKDGDPTLAGTIHETLVDPELDRFSNDDTQFLKFHGIYQQDDRDKRKSGKHFMFMIRGRIPGGILQPELYLTYDRLATDYGNNTLRVTTRQSFQFHGVVKSGLGKLMRGIHDALATTIAACGDVNRNVMSPPTPSTSPLVDRVLEDCNRVDKALLPRTPAYHQIWVEGVKLDLGENESFEDPLYGKLYLPRKFKTAFAIPPLNDIDVFTNCLGFVAIAEGENLLGYNLLAGGGMGMNHNNAETFPRMADVIGFLTPDIIEDVARAVLTVHRDYGDRTDRKHARLKYVLADRGVDWFRKELAERLGFELDPPRPFQFERQGDLFGWHKQQDGKWFVGLHVLAGRIKDTNEVQLKTALRKIVEQYRPETRLSPSQNVLLANISEDQKDAVHALFSEHGVDVDNQATVIRRASMACPALPTCGLALAESERYLPDFLDEVEGLLKEADLADEEIVIRTTGCPNGCARPYMAELALVGKAPNKYQVYVGGNQSSTRLARLIRENVRTTELADTLRPLFQRFKAERLESEKFGDFCARVIWSESDTAKN